MFMLLFSSLNQSPQKIARKVDFSDLAFDLGVHSLSLERDMSTGILADFSRELTNLSRELANFKPFTPGFDQLYPGNRRNQFTILRLTTEA